MIYFTFRVTKAFLENSNHPITIPRQCERELIRHIYDGAGSKNIPAKITPFDRRCLDGHIYFGKSGWGRYYQIRVLGRYPSDHFGHFKVGDELLVWIDKKGTSVNVSISTTEKIREIMANRLT